MNKELKVYEGDKSLLNVLASLGVGGPKLITICQKCDSPLPTGSAKCSECGFEKEK